MSERLCIHRSHRIELWPFRHLQRAHCQSTKELQRALHLLRFFTSLRACMPCSTAVWNGQHESRLRGAFQCFKIHIIDIARDPKGVTSKESMLPMTLSSSAGCREDARESRLSEVFFEPWLDVLEAAEDGYRGGRLLDADLDFGGVGCSGSALAGGSATSTASFGATAVFALWLVLPCVEGTFFGDGG